MDKIKINGIETDKVKIEIPVLEWKNVLINNKTYLINPVITVENQSILLKNYLDTMFEDEDIAHNYLTAEYTFKLGVIDLCTNISIAFENELENNNFIAWLGGGLWDIIQNSISNISEVKEKIDFVYKICREDIALDKSVGTVLENLSAEVVLFMDKISNNMQVNPEEMKKVADKFSEEVNSLNKTLGVKSDNITLNVEDKINISLIKNEKKPRKNKKIV